MTGSSKQIKVKWTEQLILLKTDAESLPPGPQRDAAMMRAQQLESAIQMEGWLKSTGLEPPK